MASHARIGIEITDTSLRLARAERAGGTRRAAKHAEIPLPEGAVLRGKMLDAASCADALKRGLSRLGGAAPAVLCLPAEAVYTAILRLDTGVRVTEDAVRAEAGALFPEPATDLRLSFRILSADADGKTVGVAAVRDDILAPWLDACVRAGLALESVTSAPCAVAAGHASGDCALVLKPAEGSGSVTVFLQGWPADEALLARGDDDAATAAALAGLLAEEPSVTDVLVAGGSALAERIGAGTAKRADAKKDDAAAPAARVTLLPAADDARTWLVADAAASSGKTAVQFVRRSAGNRQWSIFVGFLLVAAAVSAYLLYKTGAGWW